MTMVKRTISLANHIDDFITQRALELGLTTEDWIRVVLGTWVLANKPPDLPHILGVASSVARTGADAPDKFMSGASKLLYGVARLQIEHQVKAGEFKCRNCTMPLTRESIIEGKCASCQAPIFEDEQTEKPGED